MTEKNKQFIKGVGLLVLAAVLFAPYFFKWVPYSYPLTRGERSAIAIFAYFGWFPALIPAIYGIDAIVGELL